MIEPQLYVAIATKPSIKTLNEGEYIRDESRNLNIRCGKKAGTRKFGVFKKTIKSSSIRKVFQVAVTTSTAT